MAKKIFSLTTIFCITILMGILTPEHRAFAGNRIVTKYRTINYIYQVHVFDEHEAFCNLSGDIILGGGATCDSETQLNHSTAWLAGAGPTSGSLGVLIKMEDSGPRKAL